MLHLPTITIVYGAKQMSIEAKKEMNSDFVDKQRNFWMQALQDKRKHTDNAKKYVGPQDTSWWNLFFIDQQGIIDNSFSGVWPLQLPFTLSQSFAHACATRATTGVLDQRGHVILVSHFL